MKNLGVFTLSILTYLEDIFHYSGRTFLYKANSIFEVQSDLIDEAFSRGYKEEG